LLSSIVIFSDFLVSVWGRFDPVPPRRILIVWGQVGGFCAKKAQVARVLSGGFDQWAQKSESGEENVDLKRPAEIW
jgi:hypothetical protein